LALLLAIAVLAACSSDAGHGSRPTAPPPTQLGGATGHAIHVFAVRPDGTKKQLDFGQATEISSPAGTQTAGTTGKQNAPGGLHPLAGGGLTSPATIGNPGNDIAGTAWLLLDRVAVQCAQGAIPQSSGDFFDGLIGNVFQPWNTGNPVGQWFIFPNPASSCSGRLYQEQVLLCTADKLGEIGDAVGTVVLPALPVGDVGGDAGPFLFGSGDAPSGGPFFDEWDVPPQADADRFIVRDLAIHTLGILAATDATGVTTLKGTQQIAPPSCESIFSQVIPSAPGVAPAIPITTTGSSGSLQDTGNSGFVFGEVLSTCLPNIPCVPFFPPSQEAIVDVDANGNLITDHSADIARNALQVEAQILRAGGRLLHDLIRRDVYSDLAAAAHDSAQAFDPQQSNFIEWGADITHGPYGTLAHAVRVLTGRWEIGDSPSTFNFHGDPQCEGVGAINLLQQAYGSDLTARELDQPIHTQGEALAADLVAQAGIVAPACAIQVAGGKLRTALIDQLLLQVPGASASDPVGLALSRAVNGLTDADLAFGYGYALYTFSLLTNISDGVGLTDSTCNPFALTSDGKIAGLKPAMNAAPSVGNIAGIVVDGGLARSRLKTDTVARAGSLMSASQCGPGNLGDWSIFGISNFDPASTLNPQSTYSLPGLVFQDAFGIGQAFERRLVLLQAATAPLVNPTQTEAPSDPEAVARGAIAELRSWAGSGFVSTTNGTCVHLDPVTNTCTDPQTQFFSIVAGIDYSEFGVTADTNAMIRDAAVQTGLGLVYGPPWVAECAAHVRPDCPDGFDANWVQHPSTVTDLKDPGGPTDIFDGPANDGLLNPVFVVTVPESNPTAMMFKPPSFAIPGVNEAQIYVVLLHDLSDPLGRGRVLGVIHNTTETNFTIAPMQRELLHNALDLGRWVGAAPPRIGDFSAAATSGYCIDGVPRDLFVPLQNELTSDDSQSFENSWKHYLSIAQSAAATADGLARDLLQDNLQLLQNEQAASEKVADLCGDVGAIGNATTGADGVVTASPADPTLAACLHETKYDVVFLTDAALNLDLNCKTAKQDGATSPAQTTNLRKALQCTGSGISDPLCTASDPTQPTHRDLTCAVLGIPRPKPLAAFGPDCTSMTEVGQSMLTRFDADGFNNVLKSGDLTPGNVHSIDWSFQLKVTAFDDWSVQFGTSMFSLTTGTLMSSTDTTLWPACLKPDASGHGQCNPNDRIAQMLNAAYRSCPGVTDPTTLYTTGLGCDPPAGGTKGSLDSQRAELNILRWRVSGSMILLASLNGIPADTPTGGATPGEAPVGMFQMPIPVVSNTLAVMGLAGLYTKGSGPGPTTQPPAPLTGMDSLTGASLTLNPVQGVAGTSYDVPHAFNMWPATAAPGKQGAGEVPAYYFAVDTGTITLKPDPPVFAGNETVTFNPFYGPGTEKLGVNGVRHVLTSNLQITFTPPAILGLPQAPGLVDVFSQFVGDLGGTQCTGFSGGGSGGRFAQFVGALKTSGHGDDPTDIHGQEQCFLGLNDSSVATGIYPPYIPSQCTLWDSPYWYGLHNKSPCQPEREPATSPGCGNLHPDGAYTSLQVLSQEVDDPNYTGKNPGGVHFHNDGLQEGVHPPEQRVDAFANVGPPNGTCGAIAEMVQAAALACAGQLKPIIGTPIAFGSPPPAAINSVADIDILEQWLLNAAVGLSNGVGGLFVENIPARVVEDFQHNNIGTGDKSGTYGADVLNTETALNQVPGQVAAISNDLNTIQVAIGQAKNAIVGAHLDDVNQKLHNALAVVNAELQAAQAENGITSAAANGITSIATTGGAGIVGAVGNFAAAWQNASDAEDAASKITALMGAADGIANQEADNNVQAALLSLDRTASGAWADIVSQQGALGRELGTILQSAADAVLTSQKASYQIALATGADQFTVDGVNGPIAIPVNTVLNRQISGTEIRYQRALTNAKALSYMARRAIEQRLGVPLSALTSPIGPLPAPASWADDVCSLTGVNLAALNTPTPLDAGGQGSAADQQVITQFADAFVGDYVQKLQAFVDYFNVQYPSHEGDDTAVLSLRSDLLPAVSTCAALAPNLLFDSGSLDSLIGPDAVTRAIAANPTLVPGAAAAAAGETGWQVAPCRATRCLAVVTGQVLAAPQDGPFGTGQSSGSSSVVQIGTGVTWLSDVAPTGVDAGAPDAGSMDGGDASVGAAPPTSAGAGTGGVGDVVFQAVSLGAGDYVLSWWDQARDAGGNVPPPTTVAPAYVVRVFDPSGSEIATLKQAPFVPPSTGSLPLWSSRNVVTFTAAQAGIYQVAFGASTPDQAAGSVAIANVQLEAAPPGNTPSAYVETSSSRMIAKSFCPPSESDLRNAFNHDCDVSGNCFYDLVLPIVIDTEALNLGGSPLAGKLAQGNYNYRHINVAVNLVGTGVRDCTGSPTNDCFGTGYLEYDLEDDGSEASITDYNGNTRVFDFAVAGIRHGKALTAERFITLPVGSADQSLLAQPGIQHVELRGRPLDGVYRLRIWDSPALKFNHLQDVQIILNYRYWSEIVSGATGTGQGM
jgi:hypothetical protein